MRVAVIAGSHRSGAESRRVATFVRARLEAQGAEASILDLQGNPLPLWDDGFPDEPPWPEVWGPFAKTLRAADAVVVISPEWHGMVPAGVKNLLLLAGNAELAHKPGLAIGVSSGMGGAYPLAELRLTGTKNNHLVWIPEQLALRNVKSLFHGDEPASQADREVRERVDYSLRVLLLYASALQHVRADPAIDLETWPNGM